MARTFQGYVEHRSDNVIGVGSSAISSTSRMFWQNHTLLPAWERSLDERKLPVRRGFILDRDDRLRRDLIGKLMCDGDVDLNALGRPYDIDAKSYFAVELAAMRALTDLANYDEGTQRISTTPMGKLLVRNVCMVFDRYFQEATERPQFSSTI